jgi:hypothetical protein
MWLPWWPYTERTGRRRGKREGQRSSSGIASLWRRSRRRSLPCHRSVPQRLCTGGLRCTPRIFPTSSRTRPWAPCRPWCRPTGNRRTFQPRRTLWRDPRNQCSIRTSLRHPASDHQDLPGRSVHRPAHRQMQILPRHPDLSEYLGQWHQAFPNRRQRRSRSSTWPDHRPWRRTRRWSGMSPDRPSCRRGKLGLRA